VIFWRDAHYWLAVLAGPVAWAALHVLGVSHGSQASSPFVLLLSILVYPCIEEWFFRGTLQPWLRSYALLVHERFAISGANLVASISFAILHLLQHAPIWVVLVFFPSLIFGWSMERFKTLWAPVSLHVFYNAGFFLVL